MEIYSKAPSWAMSTTHHERGKNITKKKRQQRGLDAMDSQWAACDARCVSAVQEHLREGVLCGWLSAGWGRGEPQLPCEPCQR